LREMICPSFRFTGKLLQVVDARRLLIVSVMHQPTSLPCCLWSLKIKIVKKTTDNYPGFRNYSGQSK